MTDIKLANSDKVETHNHGADSSASTKLSHEATDAQRAGIGSNQLTKMTDLTHLGKYPTSTAEEKLPSLVLVHGASPKKTSWLSSIEHSAKGVMNVAEDLGKGAIKEVINHPGQILKDAAIGAAVGAAAIVLAPEVLAVAAVGSVAVAAALEIHHHGGLANTAKDIISGTKNLGHSTKVEFDRDKYSRAEQVKSKATLEGVGAFGAEATAGISGAFAGGALAGALKSALAVTTGAEAVPAVAIIDAQPIVPKAPPIESSSSSAHPVSGASAEASESAIRAKATEEFPMATGEDEKFAVNLAQQAARDGYSSPSYWAVSNLTDPGQIEQFARMYNTSYPVAIKNMEFSVEHERVEAGTEDAWRAAIAKLKD